MRKYTKVITVLFLFSFVFLNFPFYISNAEETQDNTILLIDNSSSMKKTDPQKLSVVAASMLIDTAGAADNINVIAFGGKVISTSRLKDKPSHDALKASLSTFSFNDNGTNLKDGLKEALSQLSEVNGTKRIIILSDGKEDPEGGLTQSHVEELNSLINSAYTAKTRIYSIGLSDYADTRMLSEMAYNTGGTFFSCSNPSELFDIFGKILGEQQSLETLCKYTTDREKEKTLNFSSYVEEIVIKIASVDNTNPVVEVIRDGKEEMPQKESNRYRIYDIKNDKNSSIKIASQNKLKNMVIVQMKSRAKLSASATDSSFQIPCRVPLKINLSLDGAGNIAGLYMNMTDGGKSSNITRDNKGFGFTFQKETKGEYPLFLTACDGNNNIIAVKSIDINVTDNPPFYYTEPLPDTLFTEKPFTISLKQLDSTSVQEPSGEIIANYGEEIESFPLHLKDGILSAEAKLKKGGDIKLTACINGICNNEPFSYYLPYQRINAVNRPVIDLISGKSSGVLRQDKSSTMNLTIKDGQIYKDEQIEVFDEAGNRIGEFTVKPGQKGNVKIQVIPISETSGLNLFFKGEEDLKLTGEISTNIKVLPTLKYVLEKNKFILIFVSVLVIILSALLFTGNYIYKNKIMAYRESKDIYYKINSPGKLINFEIGMRQKNIYLNLKQDKIYASDEDENAIGYFELKEPPLHPIITGLLYLFKKDSIFKVIYNQIAEQRAYIDDEESGFPLLYQSDVRIKFQYRGIKGQIDF